MNAKKSNRHFRTKISRMAVTVAAVVALTVTGGLIQVPTASAATAASAKYSTNATANKAIQSGMRYLGTPYKYGASKYTTSVFDCSSFVQRSFAQAGITLPRSSRQQSHVGTYVPRSQLKPGDLVFFYSPIHHVAIYIGNGKILHTYGKPGVTISNMNSGWWSSHYTTARRVIH